MDASASLFPIEARILQEADKISGTMVDIGQVEHVESFSKYFEVERERMDPASLLEAQILLARHPKLMISRRIPKTSVLSGTCVENRVVFTKAYDGAQVNRFYDSGFSASFEQPAFVIYAGELDPTGAAISGTFRVLNPYGGKDPLVFGGVFSLNRAME